MEAQISSELDRCWPWLAAALAHAGDTHDKADLAAMIESGHAQLWPGLRCAIVTTVETYPRFTALRLWLAGGDLDELKTLEPHLTAAARAVGAKRLEICGRPGWARVFPDARQAGVMLTREIAL